MKRCAQCGKRKFFLYENTDVCRSCYESNAQAERAARELAEQIEREQAIANAKELYKDMKTAFDNSQLNIQTWTLEELPTVISAADDFISIVQQFPTDPYLPQLFEQDCDYMETGRLLLHPVYGTFLVDYDKRYHLDRLVEDRKRIQERANRLLETSEAYSTMVSNLPETGFPILDMSQTEQRSYDVFPLKVTNITARSSVARLSSFIVIDLETTGLSPVNAEIIQIAAVQFTNFSPVKCFSTFVKPRKGLNPSAQRVNGITEQDVEAAPYIEQVIPALDELIGTGLPIVGHNLTFDANFLLTNGSRSMWEIAMGLKKTKCYDTLELARKTYGWCAAFKLDYLCRDILHIIREDSHKASSDALATGLLFHDICRRRIGSSVPDLET